MPRVLCSVCGRAGSLRLAARSCAQLRACTAPVRPQDEDGLDEDGEEEEEDEEEDEGVIDVEAKPVPKPRR